MDLIDIKTENSFQEQVRNSRIFVNININFNLYRHISLRENMRNKNLILTHTSNVFVYVVNYK